MGAAASAYKKKAAIHVADDTRFVIQKEKDIISGVIFQHEPLDHSKTAFYSSRPYRLKSDSVTIRLSFNGSGVIRVGLCLTDPKDDATFYKDPVFEQEEGFEDKHAQRWLHVNNIGIVCYGPPGTEREFGYLEQGCDLWLYIIAVFGNISVKATFGEDELSWEVFDDTHIQLEDLDATARCGSCRHSEMCMMREPIVSKQLYHIHWNMLLEDEIIAEKQPSFGYFRFGIMATKPTDMLAYTLDKGPFNNLTAWFCESAVHSYPYSGIIALTLDKHENQLTHNLMLTSVGGEKTEFIKVNMTDNVYLVMEVMSGEIEISHATGPVQQKRGSIYLVKNYNTHDDIDDLRRDISIKAGYREPCRIQFGTDPTTFIVEFNEAFTSQELDKMKKELHTSYVHPKVETSSVQVLDVPEENTAYDIEQAFSRPQLGGGEILNTTRNELLPKVWIVTYKEKNVAEQIWMKKELMLENSVIKVLPYYEDLGCAVNYGNVPVIDRTDVTLHILDADKLTFITKREMEKANFEAEVNKQVSVKVIWASRPMSDVYDDDDDEDDEDNYITFQCKVSSWAYDTLAVWKEKTQKAVDEYFEKNILIKKVDVKEASWNENIKLLGTLQKRKIFDFCEHKDVKMIKLTSSDEQTLQSVAIKIGKVRQSEDTIIEQLNKQLTVTYLVLFAEGKLGSTKTNTPNTSFMVDNKRNILTIIGPRSEVEKAKEDIIKLAANTVDIYVDLEPGKLSFFKTEQGKAMLKNKLEKKNLYKDFRLLQKKCGLKVYNDQQGTTEKKKGILQKCINSLVKTSKVKIPKNAEEVMNKEEWNKFKQTHESQTNGLIFFDSKVKDNKVILTGTKQAVKTIKPQLQMFFSMHCKGKEIVQLKTDIVEYLVIFGADEFNEKYKFVLNESGDCTGEVVIAGDENEMKLLKTELLKKASAVKTFWFHLDQKWLAGTIMELTIIDRLVRSQRCLIQADTTDSFADKGVLCAAILPQNGAVLMVLNDDIMTQRVDVIVNSANMKLVLNAGLAKAIVKKGGDVIQIECSQHVKDNGELKVGDVFMSTPGALGCRAVAHAIGPKWIDGISNEEINMKKVLKQVLQNCNDKNYMSVVFPAFCTGLLKYPDIEATTHMTEAVAEYLAKNPKSSIKEVFFCDSNMAMVDKFTDAMVKVLKNPWVKLKHRKHIKKDADFAVRGAPRRFGQTGIFGHGQDEYYTKTIRWGVHSRIFRATAGLVNYLKPTMSMFDEEEENTDEDTESEEDADYDDITEEDTDNLPSRIASLEGGLPCTIGVTKWTRLHVVKGLIEIQKVDIIVDPTPMFPGLAGAVANALVRAGGAGIVDECKKIGALKFNEVVRTHPGKLNCKHIYHVLQMMNWDQNTGFQHVYNMVMNCLTEAHNFKCSSIAFPAIGTGASKFPVDKVIRAIVKAVCDFTNKMAKTSVMDIYIVIHTGDAGTIHICENEIPRILQIPINCTYNKPKKIPFSPERRIKKKDKPKTKDKQQAPARRKDMQSRLKNKDRFENLVKYTAPAQTDNHTVADDIVFVKVTYKQDCATIQKEFERLVDQEIIKKTINVEELSEERKLSEKEETVLKGLESEFDIKIEIKQGQPLIEVFGFKKWVDDAEFKIYKYLTTDFREWRYKNKMVGRIKETVQWHYDNSGTTTPVDSESNFEIHMGYVKGVDFIYHNVQEDAKYKVIVRNLEEHPVTDPSKKRRLFQKTKEDINEPVVNSADYDDVSLCRNNQQIHDVQFCKRLVKGSGNTLLTDKRRWKSTSDLTSNSWSLWTKCNKSSQTIGGLEDEPVVNSTDYDEVSLCRNNQHIHDVQLCKRLFKVSGNTLLTEKRRWKSTSDLTSNIWSLWTECTKSSQTIGCLEDEPVVNATDYDDVSLCRNNQQIHDVQFCKRLVKGSGNTLLTEKRRWKSTSDLTSNSWSLWTECNKSSQTIGGLEDEPVVNSTDYDEVSLCKNNQQIHDVQLCKRLFKVSGNTLLTEKRRWKSTSDLTSNIWSLWTECTKSSQTIGCLEDMTFEQVFLMFDLFSEEVNTKCQSIVDYLKTIKGIKRVLPSYKVSNKNSIVFIVLIEAEINRRALLLPYPYNVLNLRLKSVKSTSAENNNITSSDIYDKADLSDEDMIKLNNVFSREAPGLLKNHSNLCAILISPVKSKQNGKNLIEVACFVMYVYAKGLIPRYEEKFPEVLDGIPTDVREGTFSVYGAHRAQKFHRKLLMGCMLSRSTYGAGTIGPFLTDQSGRIFCLTSAHVVLSPQEYNQLQNFGKMPFNDFLNGQTTPLDVYQPDMTTTDIAGFIKPFGKIRIAVYNAENPSNVGVEVVLVEVTDPRRAPVTGKFPDGQFESEGFTINNPLTFKTGLQIDKTSTVGRTEVIKYGCETGITTGIFKRNGRCVYRDTLTEGRTIILYNQIQIDSTRCTEFAKHGDSGALVLVPFNGNEGDMRALGIVVGGMQGHTSVTPLWDIFEALKEPSLELKRF